jgi:ammonium transporter, Amt family
MNVLAAPSPGSIYIPELLYAQFQSQFAAVAVGILLGAVAERARIFPTIVFTFVWTTLVYCPMVLRTPKYTDKGMLDLESNRMGL